MKVVEITPVLSTSAYADNDVLFVPIAVSTYARAYETGFPALKLVSIAVLDEADQAQAMDLVFTAGTVTLGTLNDAVNISDADARKVLGIVTIATADYVDLVNSQVATKRDVNLILQPNDTLYLSGIVGSGTPTYAASSLRIRLGFED